MAAARVALLACCLSAANAFSAPAAAFLGAASRRFPRARALGPQMALNPPDIMPKVCAWFLCQSCELKPLLSQPAVLPARVPRRLASLCTRHCVHIPFRMRCALILLLTTQGLPNRLAPPLRKPLSPALAGSEACDQWRRGTDNEDVGGSLQVSHCVCVPALCGYNKLVLTSMSTDGLWFGVQGSGSGV